jgi:hypothetical protein
MNAQPRIDIIPITLPTANRYVTKWHRHHAPIPGGFAWWACAAVANGQIVGIAIAGRPTNRNNDDGQTVEVLRVATNGTSNAPSALLGACARAAKAIGARRILTYTLTTEGGASLRGAGWVLECEDVGKSWWAHTGTRTPAVQRDHLAIPKARWGLTWRERIAVEIEADEVPPTAGQSDLFSVPKCS